MSAEQSKRQPNIIVILSDEHFGGAMSHMGDTNVHTPNMDLLASEGISFSRGYANCPVCTPSRGTIFSGRHAHAGPVQGFWDVYKPTAPSLATLLRSQDYHTAYFGKWHCGTVRNQVPPRVREHRQDYPDHQWITRTPEWHRAGFEDWFAFEVNNKPFDGFYYHQNEINPRSLHGYQTNALTDLVIDYLQCYNRDQPLLLVLSVEPPHFPLEAPECNRRINPDALALRPNFISRPDARQRLATYYAMIENLDENIGRLLAALRQIPHTANNALVSYISDHGDMMGSHGFICRKEHPHEESVRIPYLFHWPGHIPAQGLRDELISLVDFVPTVLGLIGLPTPEYVQGRDLSALVCGQPRQRQETVLLEMHGSPRWSLDYPDWRGLVSRKWKYGYYETGHELLFDLEKDPYEMRNCAKEQPRIRSTMRQKLLELLRDSREPYFDVLIEYGVEPARPVIDSGPNASGQLSGLSPYYSDGSILSNNPIN